MNAARASAFFDTNILLYMHGGPDSAKQSRARALFRDHARDGTIVLSTQVVQEFYSVGSRKSLIPHQDLQQTVAALLELPLVILAAHHVLSAIEIEQRHQISFWDALMVAAAAAAQADVLYTEDLNHGQQYGSVTACNPFA